MVVRSLRRLTYARLRLLGDGKKKGLTGNWTQDLFQLYTQIPKGRIMLLDHQAVWYSIDSFVFYGEGNYYMNEVAFRPGMTRMGAI